MVQSFNTEAIATDNNSKAKTEETTELPDDILNRTK
jgi:hypothetical protein